MSLIWVAGVTREGRGRLRGGTEKVGGDGVDWWAFRFWVTRTCHSVRCSTTFSWRLWGFVNKNFLTRIQNLPEYTPRTKGKRLIFPGKRISCMSVFPVFIYLQLDSTQQEMLDLILWLWRIVCHVWINAPHKHSNHLRSKSVKKGASPLKRYEFNRSWTFHFNNRFSVVISSLFSIQLLSFSDFVPYRWHFFGRNISLRVSILCDDNGQLRNRRFNVFATLQFCSRQAGRGSRPSSERGNDSFVLYIQWTVSLVYIDFIDVTQDILSHVFISFMK